MITERVTGMVYHAAGYDRQSQERSNRSATSPAVQRANNRAEAERRQRQGTEIVWVGHYSEKLGTSAFRADKERPEFERLINDCRKGIVNMIIVDYVSRFSRLEIMDAIPIVTELLNLGVVIVSTSEGEFRKNSLMDLIHIIMRLDAAHNESRNKSRAVKGAHDLATRLGGYVGKVPFAFELEPVSVPNPDNPKQIIVIQKLRHSRKKLTGPFKTAPAVILEAAERFAKGMDNPHHNVRGQGHSPYSLTGICTDFRLAGVPTVGQMAGKKTANSAWDPAALKRMLRDPFYAGFDRDVVRNEAGKVTGYRIKRDIAGRPVQLECGPMIPPALWWKIQPGLEATGRGKGQSVAAEPALLTAMDRLYCECGHVMVAHRTNRTDTNKRKGSYECKRGNKVLPGQHEGACTINMYGTDEHVARSIFARIQMAEVDDETADVLAEVARRWGTLNEAPEKAGERAELLAQRADAVQALEELYEDRQAGGYSGKMGRRAFLAAEAEHTLRMEAAEERLAELDEAATPTLPLESWLAHDLSADDEDYDPIGPGSWWDKASIEDRRELVALFIDRIVISKSTVIGTAPGRPAVTGPRIAIEWAKPPAKEEDEDAQAA